MFLSKKALRKKKCRVYIVVTHSIRKQKLEKGAIHRVLPAHG